MIQRPENQETPRPGTMYFVPVTSPARRRFDRDVSPVHYHAPTRRAGKSHAAPSGNLRDRQPYHRPLIALYVVGLIMLDSRQTQIRVTRFLPGRCHDALNRLLRLMPLSTRTLMRMLIGWVKKHGGREGGGYLVLDDVIVEKAFARKLPWAGWTYSFAKSRKLYGLHIVVVLLWASCDGGWRIPVAFRIWRPKRSCSARRYRTKLQLAEVMLKKEILPSGLPFGYIVFDTHYTAGWFTKKLSRLGVEWVGTLHPRTVVFRDGKRLHVGGLSRRLPLKWRAQLELRAGAVKVYAPKYGNLRLVVTRNRHGNCEYVVTNELEADLTTVIERKRSRWQVETLFRDAKQLGGLEACQCRMDQAMVRHVGLVLLTFVVLQMMRRRPGESVGKVKERWQLAVTQDGQSPPQPLKAAPAHLRATA